MTRAMRANNEGNHKHEARNPKQTQMAEKPKIQNELESDSTF